MTIPLTVPLPLTVTVTELCFLSPACQCHPSDRPPAGRHSFRAHSRRARLRYSTYKSSCPPARILRLFLAASHPQIRPAIWCPFAQSVPT
ncbi:hypothetical protein BZA05DRAFT_413469 [Tricharina praecox]|uniref:uncharacterized protein n=1 Tax=Tricharina praecox TaxID=43433 RepID=UPI00221F98A2|nr:uncharacterized protein BZA05DRAFT_413469 [Tricharina praecox]KAI5841248.1 hypothetical protein BZA05DRAFT_413469 [Tricharina praecox]